MRNVLLVAGSFAALFPTAARAALEHADGASVADVRVAVLHEVVYERGGRKPDVELLAGTTAASGGSPGECSDSYYELDPAAYSVQGTFEFYFVSGSTPSYLSVAKTEDAIKESVWNWTKATNNCGLTDDVALASAYKGRIASSVEMTSDGKCTSKGDGRSETGFGTLPSSAVAAVCVWLDYSRRPPNRVKEADIRLNKSKLWWNTVSTCKGNRYIVEAALTHERGHIWGLSHNKLSESAHGRLAMSPVIDGYCQAAETTLAKGDVLGMRARGY